MQSHAQRSGILYAALAHLIWGGFPIYFKMMQHVDAFEMLLHRIIWSTGFVVVIWLFKRQWRWFAVALSDWHVLAIFTASAFFLSLNWFVYIYAVHTDRVVEASLGYFINPLVNVLLGLIFLHEPLRRMQWLAIILATSGVIWLTWQLGHWPWIALVLALSFGTYGLLRKIGPLNALEGLTLETILLFPFAAVCWWWLIMQQHSSFFAVSPSSQGLLISVGPMTVIPLLFFASAARRISLATLGIMQYIGPTLQLFIGVVLYHEPFSQVRLIGFLFIWGALILYAIEGFFYYKGER